MRVLDENPPEDFDDWMIWRKMERAAKSCIIEHLSDTMIGIVTEEDTARDILRKLDTIYERKSLATQLAVQKKLLSFKLKGDTLLIKHFLEFDEMMIELMAAGASLNEMGKVAHLLLTLPPSYDGVVTAIQTLSEDNLSLAFVKTRLLDHEIKLQNESSDTSKKVLNLDTSQVEKWKKPPDPKKHWKSVRTFHQGRKTYRSNPHHTKGSAHLKKYSYKKTNNQRYYNTKCDHCGRRNHTKNDCYYYKKMVNDPDDRNFRTLQTVQTSENSGQNFAFMVSRGVLQRRNETSEITFILDSGATDHLVNQPDVFTTFTKLVSPLKIAVAKSDTSISATMKGTIHVITNQGVKGVLKDVLYAADVPYNLLSVRRIQEAGMSIIFAENGGVTNHPQGKYNYHDR